ncbi:MAG: hypothetical protein M1814_001174 [Vezdaea aestivalis]|nr:MAG: hypothetical protein M1814_001174 [Vezdaea aestivalis]
MAMSALFYGYAGNSASSPYNLPALTFWDDRRIAITVTRDYVGSKLTAEQKPFLDKETAFGSELTDETYSSWIIGRAKRLFLVLLDIGVPGDIFKLIDQSIDDQDLPLSMQSLEQLNIVREKEGSSLAKKFHKRQFTYMLRGPIEGGHIDYAADEVVPIELANRRPIMSGYQGAEKVLLSEKRDKVLVRRRIEYGNGPGKTTEKDFMREVDAMKFITHQHIVSIYATYSHQESGYILLQPATDISLRNFLAIPPPHFRMLPKQDRRRTILSWLHCLADALTFLHDKGLCHGEIQPSNIFIDGSNVIVLGVPERYRKMRTDKRPSTLESYEYGAPEKWGQGAFTYQTSALRRKPSSNKGWKLSIHSAPAPITDTFSLKSHTSGCSSPISTQSWPTRPFTPATTMSSATSRSSTIPLDGQRADIFSLSCIYLDILTHILKRKIASFISHRSASPNKTSRKSVRLPGGAPADASFHANISQVELWMAGLRRDSFRRRDDVFDGVPALLTLCTSMLEKDPRNRPDAWDVADRVADVLNGMCHLPALHCGATAEEEQGEWDFCCAGAREIVPWRTGKGWREEVKMWEDEVKI